MEMSLPPQHFLIVRVLYVLETLAISMEKDFCGSFTEKRMLPVYGLPAAVVVRTPNSTIPTQDIIDVVGQELADYLLMIYL